MFWRKTSFQVVVFYAAYFNFYFFVPRPEVDGEIVTMILSMATFIFAIIVGFSISGRHGRLTEIRTRLRENDARLLNMYKLSAVFGKIKSKKCLKLIEDSLISQLDYKLVDIHRSTPTLLKLHDFILELKPKTSTQNNAEYLLMDNMGGVLRNVREVSHLVDSKMSKHEWGSLFLLSTIIWFSLFLIGGGSIISWIVIPLLATVLGLLMFILQDFNNLRWGERTWIWRPISRLFLDLGLKPYMPEAVLRGRVSKRFLKNLAVYRVGTFPNKYPDLRGKKVITIKNK
ncbi:MAG: hypothetical protein HQ488_03215 [Parcubacteria group bacterium]|nr:hypothetical protein [Parcubacteria group bacterium]